MSGALAVPLQQEPLAPSSAELCAVLSRAIEPSRPRTRIVGLERAPCPNVSSWWLEEITLDVSDGSRIALVFKDLIREAEGSDARRVKPAFVTDPARERWVYEHLLIAAAPGPPKLWAAVTDFSAGRHWLFLERVHGTPLTRFGDTAWYSAAEWLGRFHATAPVQRAVRGPLLRHDRKYHQRWMARALSTARHHAKSSAAARDAARDKVERLRALAPMHERAIAAALAASPSVIHGEFYPSNVLVRQSDASVAIHPVDWEMAAVGPPLLDLAALTSGRWSESSRAAMATAYREGARSAGVRGPTVDEILRGVAAARLLLAVQWLGWAAEWTAPEEHRNDWLEEAELCSSELRA